MCKGLILGAQPFVLAFVVFKAHTVGEIPPLPLLQFLVDTGAEKTMISAGDAEKLGIEYRLSPEGVYMPFFGGFPLEKGPIMGGVGGRVQSFIVPEVYFYFVTPLDNIFELHLEYLDLIYVPEGKVRGIPNLLGWDILSRFEQHWQLAPEGQGSIEFSRIVKPGSYYVSYIERAALGL